MGVEEHKHDAPKSVDVRVLVVSSTRKADTDESGKLIADLCEAAGHRVLAREVVTDDTNAIVNTLRRWALEASPQVAILTGGTGLSRLDVTPEAVEPLFDRRLDGFGELFRWLSYQEIGAAAMMSRATAGMMGPVLVFALPGSTNAVKLAVEKLILPELGHLVRVLTKDGVPMGPGATVAASQGPIAPPAHKVEKVEKEAPAAGPKKPEPPKLPEPSGTLGRLGRNQMNVGLDQDSTKPEAGGAADGLPVGWERAVYEVRGEVTKGGWPTIPEELEKVAPVVDVLHRAGERGTMRLPSGRTYALFGFPNLGKGAKVLAIGDGSPLGEIVALHRYPAMTGALIDEGNGLLPGRASPVASTAEAVTGRPPKDASGQVLAVQGDAVFVQRGTRAVKWDGSRETDLGTAKQALASLVLDWVQR